MRYTRSHPSAAAVRPALAESRSVALPSALFAAVLGMFILYGVGFAQPNALHAAAHDVRHALAFPCH